MPNSSLISKARPTGTLGQSNSYSLSQIFHLELLVLSLDTLEKISVKCYKKHAFYISIYLSNIHPKNIYLTHGSMCIKVHNATYN